MQSLLAIEWLKIKRYRTFWVLAGLFLLLLPLWNYQIAKGFINLGGGKKGGVNLLNTAYSFPQVWGNLGFWGSIFILFISMLVIILTTNEYAYRTHRQNVIDGWKRIEFYHAKVMLVVVLSLVVTVYLFLLGLLFGRATSGSFSGALSGVSQVGYFFVLSLDYLGLALFISVWIKRSGLAIGLFLLYSMIIENILRGVINHYADMPYGNMLLLQSSDELLPFQMMQMAKAMLQSGPVISNTTYMVVTAAWCVAYYIAGRVMILRSNW